MAIMTVFQGSELDLDRVPRIANKYPLYPPLLYSVFFEKVDEWNERLKEVQFSQRTPKSL